MLTIETTPNGLHISHTGTLAYLLHTYDTFDLVWRTVQMVRQHGQGIGSPLAGIDCQPPRKR